VGIGEGKVNDHGFHVDGVEGGNSGEEEEGDGVEKAAEEIRRTFPKKQDHEGGGECAGDVFADDGADEGEEGERVEED